MRIAITGSRGFIGGCFGRYAAAAGHEVLGISRSSQAEADWPGQHAHADGAFGDLSPFLRGFQPDVVLHAAGGASVPESMEHPMEDLRGAVLTLANTMEGIRRAGIGPALVYLSSGAVYGQPAKPPVAEGALIAPVSPFGFHKAACELLAREAAEIMGMRVVICRLFSVYGPRQRRRLIWDVYRQLIGEVGVIDLHGTGSETRDYLHSDDLCPALLALMEHVRRGCTTVNVASGTEISVAQLVEEIKRVTGIDKMLMCRGIPRPGEPPHTVADIARLRELAPGWRSRPVREGLAETIAQWQAGK
ncbi:MAG TPA: NAD(P)-dependent oxidoreductase [Chthoniobacteraceae bacterium]|jgi:nucleoside-diphosphate-sugar epimerase|nr:NAD(P)-dependent oxidoreductase [Chthoniobacteraceae bacterium]